MPTKAVEAASDDWFADFDGDGVPEAAVGRLPARTLSAAAALVAKVIGYGEATARAKAAVNDLDVRRSDVLFGDPSMKLN